jgi:hypothetical protein
MKALTIKNTRARNRMVDMITCCDTMTTLVERMIIIINASESQTKTSDKKIKTLVVKTYPNDDFSAMSMTALEGQTILSTIKKRLLTLTRYRLSFCLKLSRK